MLKYYLMIIIIIYLIFAISFEVVRTDRIHICLATNNSFK